MKFIRMLAFVVYRLLLNFTTAYIKLVNTANNADNNIKKAQKLLDSLSSLSSLSKCNLSSKNTIPESAGNTESILEIVVMM